MVLIIPVLNVFRMFGMMNGKGLRSQSDNGFIVTDIVTKGVSEKSDINAIAVKMETQYQS
jgi:hypothetical protein